MKVSRFSHGKAKSYRKVWQNCSYTNTPWYWCKYFQLCYSLVKLTLLKLHTLQYQDTQGGLNTLSCYHYRQVSHTDCIERWTTCSSLWGIWLVTKISQQISSEAQKQFLSLVFFCVWAIFIFIFLELEVTIFRWDGALYPQTVWGQFKHSYLPLRKLRLVKLEHRFLCTGF